MQRSLRVTRLALQRQAQCTPQQVATLTYRAHSGRSLRCIGSHPLAAPSAAERVLLSQACTQLLARRSFFWSKKPTPEEEAAVAATLAAEEAAAIAAQQHQAAEAAATAAAAEAEAEALALAKTREEQRLREQQEEQQRQQQQTQTVEVIPISQASSESKAERLGFDLSALSSQLSWPRIKTYSIYIAVGAGVLAVFKVGLNIIDFMASVSFLDVGEVAFIGGLLTGAGVMVCAMLGTRFLRLRPEPCFRHALRRLQSDPSVAEIMGSPLVPSDFRAYNTLDGAVRLTSEQRAMAAAKQQSGLYKWWQPKRLQMMFQITGANGQTGMATVEVEKNWRGDHVYNLLSVEVADEAAHEVKRIILEGDPDYKIYKGVIRLR